MDSAPPGALSPAFRGRQPGARLGGANTWPVSLLAVGRRLDAGARYAGPRGAQLSQPLGGAAAWRRRQVSGARERILGNIRSSLNRGRLDAKTETELHA